MFGTLRFLLALAVALGHVGISVGGRHPGVPAVVVFFMLSGYVVAGLLQRNFPSRADIPSFFLERFLRLAPLYYLMLLAGALAFALDVRTSWLAGPPGAGVWLANLLVIPLNYYMLYPPIDSFFLIPVAWSLGLEIQFYLIAPWLLKTPRRIGAMLIASLIVYAVANLGGLQPDWFGYRLLCGNLFMFLAGVLLYHARTLPRLRQVLAGLWLTVLAIFLLAALGDPREGSFALETGAGFLVGLPLLAGLSALPRRRLDDWLGNLAYGIFLAHFPVMWLAGLAGWLSAEARPLGVYLLLVILAALVGHVLVERPLVMLRHRLRERR